MMEVTFEEWSQYLSPLGHAEVQLAMQRAINARQAAQIEDLESRLEPVAE